MDANVGWHRAIQILESEGIPADSELWGIRTSGRWTIAHTAAMRGLLPVDFNRWDMADGMGWTVAHIAVQLIDVKEFSDFSKEWLLTSRNGTTVAHTAAKKGTLPKKSGFLPDETWKRTNKDGETVAYLAVTNGGLPIYFTEWGILHTDGRPIIQILLDNIAKYDDEHIAKMLDYNENNWDKLPTESKVALKLFAAEWYTRIGTNSVMTSDELSASNGISTM
jgi:hypothetical protein